MKPLGRRKRVTRLCSICRQRPARYRRPAGGYGREPQHDACTRCYRRMLDRLHAVRMADERHGEVCAEISAR